MKKIVLILTAILCKQFLLAQGGFSKNYFPPNSYLSVCTDAFEAPNGNIIMAGRTYDNITGSNRLTIIIADAQGNQLSQKNYGSNKFEYLIDNNLYSRSILKSINCFYLYSTVRDSNNKYLSAFIKFNFNGDTLWQKKYYDSTDYLYIEGVTKSVDNGFLMTGLFEGQTNQSCLLIKTDSMGNELWRKKLNKTVPDVQCGSNIIQDSLTKKIVIAGYQYIGNASAYSGFDCVFVTDSLGNELHRKSYSGACGGSFRDIVQTKDKKCIAVGEDNQCSNLGGPNGFPRNKGYVVKFDLNNLSNVIWYQAFDTLSIYNSIVTIDELPSGDLILGGLLDTLSNYSINDKEMLRLIKLDKDGNLKWNKKFSRDNANENSKFLSNLNVTASGSYLTANDLYDAPAPKAYNITKIDSMGCDSTLAYCQTVGFEEYSLIKESLKIYPNPGNGILTIESPELFLIPGAKLKVSNVLGQTIFECAAQNKIDISAAPKGIYFLEIYNKEKLISTEKIIKE